MSTGESTYSEYVHVPRRRGPAFGELGPPPEADEKPDDAGPLDRRTEAAIGFAIVIPVLASYAALGYGVYRAVSPLL